MRRRYMKMFRILGLTIFIALSGLTTANGAESREQQLRKWFCAVLKPDFDAKSAIAAFPLEKLPPSQETSSPSDKDSMVWEVSAEGESYKVTYRWQANLKNVTDTYGFTLQVQELMSAAHPILNSEQQKAKWVAKFGKPKEEVVGKYAQFGPKIGGGMGMAPFSIGAWYNAPIVEATWFTKASIKHAGEACKQG
jgi:hypothetical protein